MTLAIKKLTYPFLLVFISTLLFAQTFPEKSDHLVTDYTHTLSTEQAGHLEKKLVAFDDSTSTQIAVVIIRSLEGYEIADYGVRLAQKWGIGHKKKNNGILLLVSLGDRKVTIETGYGVEGALPDAIARRIIENEIKPNFKQDNYYQGLEQGTDAIIAYTKGEYKNDSIQKGGSAHGGRGLFLVILVIIIIVIIARINRGGGNGGSQVIGGRGEASPLWWIFLGSILGGRGGSSGGWGGSSNDGGGFGGFGGGGFGGGGASGDW